MTAVVLGALLIFGLRITDVSIGMLRVLYAVRGQRLVAALLGVAESGIFIVAISRVFAHLDNPLNMVAYALGFGTGTALGMTLEKWIASGSVLVRVISRKRPRELLEALRAAHFGVTSVSGEGQRGEVLVMFVVTKRKRGREALALVKQIDPEAFVTIDPVTTAMGGYLPLVAGPASVRK